MNKHFMHCLVNKMIGLAETRQVAEAERGKYQPFSLRPGKLRLGRKMDASSQRGFEVNAQVLYHVAVKGRCPSC